MAMTPERSLAQRREALEKANRVRFAHRDLKRDLREGRRKIEEVLLDPPPDAASIELMSLLRAVPGWGAVSIGRALAAAGIGTSRRRVLGGLTPRQRDALVEALAWGPRRPRRDPVYPQWR